MAKEMTLLEHLEELRNRVVRIIVTVIVIGVFTFLLKIESYDLNSTLNLGGLNLTISKIYYPVLDPFANIASQFITRIAADMLPKDIRFIFTSPEQAIVAEVYVSVFIGILIGMPVAVREISAFVNPAFYPNERKMILNVLAPATFLFLTGCVFSYIWLTPFTIDFLYGYSRAITGPGNTPPLLFITPLDLIGFVLIFVVAIGLTFELPIIMWLLSKARIVQPKFWWDNFRYAVVAMVIFGAIITPDGSGITMWFVALPMIVLYLAGYLFIRAKIKPKSEQ